MTERTYGGYLLRDIPSWIPVTERLPELVEITPVTNTKLSHAVAVLVDYDKHHAYVDRLRKLDGHGELDWLLNGESVIAWCPLPFIELAPEYGS